MRKPPLRTLIIDASEAFRDGVIRWAGERSDLVVVGTARSGPEGLAAVEELDPDLVLVDAVLPELDGFQTVRAIKAHAGAPLAVFVTFVANSAVQAEAFAAGADGFVPKDDFTAAFELLLDDLIEAGDRPRGAVSSRERPAPRESRIERDP